MNVLSPIGLRPANLGETNLGEVSEDGDHVSWKRLKVRTLCSVYSFLGELVY